MKQAIKLAVMAAYCHGWLSAAVVALVFRHVDLKGA